MPAITVNAQGFLETVASKVPYLELGEFGERFGADGVQEIRRVCLVPVARKYDFMADMLPDVRLQDYPVGEEQINKVIDIDGSLTNLFRRQLIRKDPEMHPRRTHLFVTDCESFDGFGYPGRDSLNLLTFRIQGEPAPAHSDGDGFVKIVVTYRSLPYVIGPGNAFANLPGNSELIRYVQRQRAPSGENIPLPHVSSETGRFKWASSITGTGFEPGVRTVQTQNIIKTLYKIHLIYTWYMVPAIPTTSYIMLGQVNSKDFDSENGIFRPLGSTADALPRGPFRPTRCLYANPEITKEYKTFSGQVVQDITYHILARPNIGGHQAFLSPYNFQFDRITWPPPMGISAPVIAPGLWTYGISVTITGGFTSLLRPPSGDSVTATQVNPLDPAQGIYGGRDVYTFGDLNNLFRIDA